MEEQQPTKTLPQILPLLKQLFQQALSTAFPDIPDKITITSLAFNNKFNSEYQSSTGLKLFNQYKKTGSLGYSSPSEISSKIISTLPGEWSCYINPPIVNPQGFINITLCDKFLTETVNRMLQYGINLTTSEKHKYAVDFSSPNIAKDMHVGHLRSTIIGESICRILEECGHEVLRINHLGDWGTQFGMLIERLREAFPDYLVNKPNLTDLQSFYKEAKKRYDSDAEFKKRAQLNVTKLQKYEKEEYLAWEMICQLSREGFNKIYKRLDITVFEYGESFYNKMIPDTLKELREKNMVVEDKGAQCIFVKKGSIPLMVVKSDGGYNYDTTDMAAINYRLNTLHCDRLLYCTDVGQEPHFRLIFLAAEKAGWLVPPKQTAQHMGFGLVLGADGQKMKTKEGDTVPLQVLLDKAKEEALRGLVERAKEKGKGQVTNLKEEEFDEAAERIGIGAVKYYDLRQSRIQNYKFDEKKMTDFKGNTAVYLFYSYTRICSILKKSEIPEEKFTELIKQGFEITHDAEKELINILVKFQDIVETITLELEIHKLTDFLYALAVKLSESYQKFKILGEEHTKTRVLLCLAIKHVMEKAMFLLGIKPLDKL